MSIVGDAHHFQSHFSHWMTVIARETLILGINYFITHVNNTLCIGMFQIKCFLKVFGSRLGFICLARSC